MEDRADTHTRPGPIAPAARARTRLLGRARPLGRARGGPGCFLEVKKARTEGIGDRTTGTEVPGRAGASERGRALLKITDGEGR